VDDTPFSSMTLWYTVSCSDHGLLGLRIAGFCSIAANASKLYNRSQYCLAVPGCVSMSATPLQRGPKFLRCPNSPLACQGRCDLQFQNYQIREKDSVLKACTTLFCQESRPRATLAGELHIVEAAMQFGL